MRGTINKLVGVSISLACLAAGSFYLGGRAAREAAPGPQPANPFAGQFTGEPGDGWVLFGGFLLLVAVALIAAGLMLRTQEGRGQG
ncbi:MAG TPA: hypothetical protein VEY09_00835 [Pyrinomonadaceae bacterium]|nr:hypothetical protein [Pyrinomonadaceae bacterium]